MIRKIKVSLVPLLLFLFWSSPAAAQCAMCRAALQGQVESVVQAINLGIIILLIPPLAIMSAILFITFRQDR